MLRPDAIQIQKKSKRMMITHTDVSGELKQQEFDMVVLATAMAHNEGTEKIAEILDVKLGEDGFL